jgi:hypothetical protein
MHVTYGTRLYVSGICYSLLFAFTVSGTSETHCTMFDETHLPVIVPLVAFPLCKGKFVALHATKAYREEMV